MTEVELTWKITHVCVSGCAWAGARAAAAAGTPLRLRCISTRRRTHTVSFIIFFFTKSYLILFLHLAK
jgi:hypothetical protein